MKHCWVALSVIALILSSCAQRTPTPEETPDLAPMLTPAPTPTVIPTPTATPTPTQRVVEEEKAAELVPTPTPKGTEITSRELRAIALQYFHPTEASLDGLRSRGLESTGLRPLYPSGATCPEADSFFGDTTRGDGSTRAVRFYHGYHTGLDIPVPEGTPVLAIADGIVVAKSVGGEDGIGGISIVLQHAPEDTGYSVWLYSEYKHLKEMPRLEVGERVELGSQIALAGKTGTEGPYYGTEGRSHLHLTVFMSPDDLYVAQPFFYPPNGQWIDPLTVYLGEPLDTSSVRSLPADAKTVAISCVTDAGGAFGGQTRFIWPFACTSTVPTPTLTPQERYNGPMIDVHSHLVQGLDADKVISLLDEAGVSRVVLMPRQGAGGPNDSRTLSFFDKHPDRFIPFIAFNVPRWGQEQDPTFPSYVESQLKTGKFKGLGEVILRAYREEREPVYYDIPPDGPLTLQIVDLAAKYGVPMVIHHEAEDETIPSLERMLEHNRKAIIIWGHQGRADADTLRKLMDKHTNLYADISGLDPSRPYGRDKNPIATQDGHLMEKYRDLYETYSERFMFGPEAAFLDNWEQYADLVYFYRKILGQLTAETAEKIAYKNAQKMFALQAATQ